MDRLNPRTVAYWLGTQTSVHRINISSISTSRVSSVHPKHLLEYEARPLGFEQTQHSTDAADFQGYSYWMSLAEEEQVKILMFSPSSRLATPEPAPWQKLEY